VIAVVVGLCINLQRDVVALNSIFPCLRNISSHFFAYATTPSLSNKNTMSYRETA